MLALAIGEHGSLEIEKEVSARGAQRLDGVFTPARPWIENLELGVLNRMEREECVFEFEASTPTEEAVHRCIHRRYTLWSLRVRDAPKAMDSRATRRRAIADVLAMPEGSHVRKQILEIVAQWDQSGTEAAEPVSKESEAMHPFLEKNFPRFVERMKQIDRDMAEARAEGVATGIAPLARQFERKLSRPLSTEEGALLRQKLDAVGPDRLGDAVLDMAGEQLASWLVDPDAR